MIVKTHHARLVFHGFSGPIDDIPTGPVTYLDEHDTWKLGFVVEVRLGLTHTARVLFGDDGEAVDPKTPDTSDPSTLLFPMQMRIDE